VKKDNTTITGPDSFKDGTKKVCSVTGSTPAENIKTYVKDVGSQLVLFDTYDKCRDALKGGQVDAVTTDNVILLGYIAKDEASFKLAGSNFTKEPYGMGEEGGRGFAASSTTRWRRSANGGWKSWTAPPARSRPDRRASAVVRYSQP
jgi:glutamate transport system substrate-binding protein